MPAMATVGTSSSGHHSSGPRTQSQLIPRVAASVLVLVDLRRSASESTPGEALLQKHSPLARTGGSGWRFRLRTRT